MRRREPRIRLDPWAAEYEGPGTMIVQQPEIPTPVLVRSPFPAWATRKTEVAAMVPEADVFKGFTDG